MNQVNQRPWNCCWGLLWILCSPRAGNCWIPLLFRPCTPLRFGKDCKKNKKKKKQKNYIVLKQTKNIPNARVPSDEKINHGKINLYSRLTGVVEIKPGMNVAFKFSPLILKASLLTETSRCLRYLIYIWIQ